MFDVFIKFSEYSILVRTLVASWVVFTAVIGVVAIFAKPIKKNPEQPTTLSNDRPAMIKIGEVKGLTIKNNTITGDADLANIGKGIDVHVSGNKQINQPKNKK